MEKNDAILKAQITRATEDEVCFFIEIPRHTHATKSTTIKQDANGPLGIEEDYMGR